MPDEWRDFSFETLVLGELRAFNSYRRKDKRFFHYTGTGGFDVDFIVETQKIDEPATNDAAHGRTASRPLQSLDRVDVNQAAGNVTIVVSVDELAPVGMPVGRVLAPPANVPDGECHDGPPELVVRGEHPWLVSSRHAPDSRQGRDVLKRRRRDSPTRYQRDHEKNHKHDKEQFRDVSRRC
jgi:hypothetical protein